MRCVTGVSKTSTSMCAKHAVEVTHTTQWSFVKTVTLWFIHLAQLFKLTRYMRVWPCLKRISTMLTIVSKKYSNPCLHSLNSAIVTSKPSSTTRMMTRKTKMRMTLKTRMMHRKLVVLRWPHLSSAVFHMGAQGAWQKKKELGTTLQQIPIKNLTGALSRRLTKIIYSTFTNWSRSYSKSDRNTSHNWIRC